MSAMGMVAIILFLHVHHITGQTYNLSGPAFYGIKGDYYRFTCEISGGNLPEAVRFNKGGHFPCFVKLPSCLPSSTNPTKYTCGCKYGNKRQLYFYIRYVQSTDAGTWTCGYTFNISPPVALPVYYAPILDPNKETKTSISVELGETGVLSIHVLAYPPPVYTWYYQQQDGSERLVAHRKEHNGLSSTLTIQNVGENDGGKYIVNVTNSLGTRSIQFNVVVTSFLIIGIPTIIVLFGIATGVITSMLVKKKHPSRHTTGDQTVNHDTSLSDTLRDTTNHDNISLSDMPQVDDRVGVTNARATANTTGLPQASTTESVNTRLQQSSATESVNPDYINTSTTSSPYGVLNKQTMDQEHSTYQQLSLYQNLSGDKN